MASFLDGTFDRVHGRLAATTVPRVVEPADIAEMRNPNGLLTDTGITIITRMYGSIPSRVNFVDPVWLATWERDGCPQYTEFPDFFRASSAAHPLQGLAMPYNVYGHWAVVYFNLEKRGAIYFDSMLGSHGASVLKPLALKFWKAFHQLFELGHILEGDSDHFQFEIDTKCAKQNDSTSCGIYAVRTCLDLMELRRPSGEVLKPNQIATFRTIGTKVLEDARQREQSASILLDDARVPRVPRFWRQNFNFT